MFRSDTVLKGSFLLLSLMIFGMVFIGGLTRLTGSGLSIVEWKPVTGIFPPLTFESWMIEFSKYQQTPEFQKINFNMNLMEFKSIFFLEYFHRLGGRLIGLVLLIPTLIIVRKRQYKELRFLILFLWALGLAQGVMGWVMVKSGLLHDPQVSPYRLSAHLFLGFMTLGTTLWIIFLLYKNTFARESPLPRKYLSALRYAVLFALFFVLLTAIFGAFVAGLKAGLLYNTFPFMGEKIIPREFLTLTPWWKDIFENPVTVQFCHRIFAFLTVIICTNIFLFQRKVTLPKPLKLAFKGMILAIIVQFTLGICTLLYMVPHFLALLHQSFSFILFGSLIYIHFQITHILNFRSLNGASFFKTADLTFWRRSEGQSSYK